MKKLLILPLFLICSISMFATNPVKKDIAKTKINALEKGASVIDSELADINAAKDVIMLEGIDYNEFVEKYPELASKVSVKPTVDDDVLAGSDEPPLGIPSFVWGFCFGILGVLLVYVLMEDSNARKEQVKKAFIGCLVGGVLSGVIYLIAIAASAM